MAGQAGGAESAITWPRTRERRRWEDRALAGQLDMADRLAAALANGRLDAPAFARWLETQERLCRLSARTLRLIARWHASDPVLAETAQQWALAEERDAALLATAPAAGASGEDRPPPALDAWDRFLASAAISPRAGEALGAVLLHARLLQGGMRPVLAAVLALPPPGPGARRYLLQRSHADPALERVRVPLLDAYAAASLAAGAARAAEWSVACLEHCLAAVPSAPAFPSTGRQPVPA